MDSTILLVDDNKLFLEIEKEYLQSSPVEVLTAKNGLEAIHVIRNKRPDLVFMDMQMPKMDGIACCRAIKSDPSFNTIPVVMVTSRGNENDQNNSCSAGCDDYITKPLDRGHFLSVARSFIPSINRREKRVQTLITAVFRVNNESMSCAIHNVSVGGAFLHSDYFGVPGCVIQLTFTLPGGTVIECHGRIVWANRVSSQMPMGFGVQFALLPKDAKEALSKYIQEVK